MHPRDRIEYRIAALKGAGLWRDPAAGGGPPEPGFVDARSNDYLGLAPRTVSRETTGPVGAGASRLVSGTHAEHRQLEQALAEWLGFEDCLLFSSGYAANVGAISALAGPGETILSDSLNHASIIDGCRLSRAETIVLPHRDVGALERALAAGRGVRWVVTESYFGMDGDSPDLAALRRVCQTHGAALIVDEAHAIGVFGAQGRGLCAALEARPDVLVGGMGKALGIHGGFVACSSTYREWLWNRARSLVFSTAPSPLLCSLALGRVRQVREAEPERARLRELERRLAVRLAQAGVEMPLGRHGPLFPIVLGTENAVLAGAQRARELGVLCHPIRPPTVPRGGSRLRVTLRADMSEDDVDTLARALTSAWAERKFDDPPAVFDARLGPSSGEVVATTSTSDAPTRERETATELQADNERANLEQSLRRFGGALPPPADGRSAPPRRAPEVSLARQASPALPGVGSSKDVAARAVPQRPPPVAERPSIAPASSSQAERSEGQEPQSHRWLVLGTGTSVGKTFVAQALVRALAAANEPVAGLKPVETGVAQGVAGDAATLAALASHVKLPSPHPLYGFADPVTPSRAARAQGIAIDLDRIARWTRAAVATTERASQLVIETAGGVFSPLSDHQTNFDLSIALDPAIWLLVAPNRLGVLHDVTSALHAMTALGRRPDWIILSAPETPDTSTSSNRTELSRLQSMPPILELPRNDARPLEALLRTLTR
jgi:8-amino-7-oxononanoate synthase